MFISSYSQICTKATVFGGDASNQLVQLAVAPDHSVYHAGTFDGADFEIQGQTLEALEDPTMTHVNPNYYILKLNGSNELQWLKRLEGDYYNRLIINRLTTDSDNNCYLKADIKGTATFAGHTFIERTKLGHVIIKLSPEGEYLWHTYFEWTANYTTSFLNDSTGNIVFMGTYYDYTPVYFENAQGVETQYEHDNSGEVNYVCGISQATGHVTYFTDLHEFAGIINVYDNYVPTTCIPYLVNNELYITARFYGYGYENSTRILKLTGSGLNVSHETTIDGPVNTMFGTPHNNGIVYIENSFEDSCYINKYNSDFSQVLACGSTAGSEAIFWNYTNNSNWSIDNNGNIILIYNPMDRRYFTYNGDTIEETSYRKYRLFYFSEDLELLYNKPIIDGDDYETFHAMSYNKDDNTIRLFGNGKISNQIDDVSYTIEGYQHDIIILDFDNEQNFEKAITVSDTEITLLKDETKQLNASVEPESSGDVIVWVSLDESIATVSDDGLVTAIYGGQTEIIASLDGTEIADTCTVTILLPVEDVILTPENVNIPISETEILHAVVMPLLYVEDNTVSWKSLDDKIASISQEGLLTAVGGGETKIIVVTNSGGYTDTCIVNVKLPVDSVILTPKELTLSVGEVEILYAKVMPSFYVEDSSITWKSLDINIASVNQDGLLRAIAIGETKIIVTTNIGGFTDTCNVTVSGANAINNFRTDNITVYPNPANNYLKIKGIETDFKTEIIGIDGKVYIHSKNNKSIDVTCLKSGIYVVKIYSDNNIVFHKIIKQ
jgi:uncharacterized protein YjdB